MDVAQAAGLRCSQHLLAIQQGVRCPVPSKTATARGSSRRAAATHDVALDVARATGLRCSQQLLAIQQGVRCPGSSKTAPAWGSS
eukprot:5719220-Alexandrium_andersonii.AAC.1